MKAFVVGFILVIALAIGVRSAWVHPSVHVVPDTVYLKVSEQSKAVADTVTKVLTRFKTVRESTIVNIHDTVSVKEFIRLTDTVVVACTRCAEQLRLLRRVSDSIIKARDDTIYALRTRLQSCKGSRPWWAVTGLGAGVLACRR